MGHSKELLASRISLASSSADRIFIKESVNWIIPEQSGSAGSQPNKGDSEEVPEGVENKKFKHKQIAKRKRFSDSKWEEERVVHIP